MPVTPSLRSRAGSEHIRSAQGKLREGSGSMDGEILRCAQDDSQVPALQAVGAFFQGEILRCAQDDSQDTSQGMSP